MSEEKVTVNGTEYIISESETQKQLQISECDGSRIAVLDMDGADYGQKEEAEGEFESHVRRQDNIPKEDLMKIYIPRAFAHEI